jgi:hypothetical protein
MGPTTDGTVQSGALELHRAFQRLESEIRDGLGHGFFDLSVVCEVIKGGKRRLTIRAGKSYQFLIGEEESMIARR